VAGGAGRRSESGHAVNAGSKTCPFRKLRGRNPPSQTWKTFLRNHAQAIAAIDMCVVPTLTFEVLFAFLVLGHSRRQLLWIEVTQHPTAEGLARQITEAFPWSSAPAYLVRDNDGAYGHVFTRRLWAMGIRDRPISPRSPWQNGHAERLKADHRKRTPAMPVRIGSACAMVAAVKAAIATGGVVPFDSIDYEETFSDVRTTRPRAEDRVEVTDDDIGKRWLKASRPCSQR
jgi:hypothetical protein